MQLVEIFDFINNLAERESELAESEGLFGPAGLTPSGPPSGRSRDWMLEASGHDTQVKARL
jgi:hypothetical protein